MMVSIKDARFRCLKCHHDLYDLDDQKDIKWVPNGHKYKMGDKMVEAYDPVVIRGTCCYCHTVVDFEELRKEKVLFT